MNTIKKLNNSSPKTYKGDEVLEAPAGTILEVTSATNEGYIIMRTSSSTRPFVTLKDGKLWDNSLYVYTFKTIINSIQIN
jgi:hypothetical protein